MAAMDVWIENTHARTHADNHLDIHKKNATTTLGMSIVYNMNISCLRPMQLELEMFWDIPATTTRAATAAAHEHEKTCRKSFNELFVYLLAVAFQYTTKIFAASSMY